MKEKKTAEQLEALIFERCAGMDIYSLGVHRDDTSGSWYAIVVAHPTKVADYQSWVDEVVSDLKGWFELDESA
jgi:phage terminase large subunit-like protein